MNDVMQPSGDLGSAAREIRRLVLEMAYRSKTGHVGSALSIADILAVLYARVLNVRPADPEWSDRDRLLLSKGHAAAALYAALALKGYFPVEDLEGYCRDGGRFHGHPCKHAAPGIEYSFGSLGHGLPIAAGIAFGLDEGNPSSIFAILGDGECNEGSVWEAAMFIATHGLRRVTAVIDRNQFQGFGSTDAVHPVDLNAMWKAFGWDVIDIDGHDLTALETALGQAKASERPTSIIANTIAGKGVPEIEGTLRSHYCTFDQEAFDRAIRDIYAQ